VIDASLVLTFIFLVSEYIKNQNKVSELFDLT